MGGDVSQIEDTNKIREFFWAFFWNCAEIGKWGEIIDRNEFNEKRQKGLEARNIEVKLLEEQDGGRREVGNHELKEMQVINAFGGGID